MTMRSTLTLQIAIVALAGAAAACSGQNSGEAVPPVASTHATTPATQSAEPPASDDTDSSDSNQMYDDLPEDMRGIVDTSFLGDFDDMVKRRVVRIAVTFNRTHYFIDQGHQRGLAYEMGKLFEDDLNKELKTGNLKVHVVFVPVPRNQLQAALLNGKVDLVAAMVTVTPEREQLADFSEPTRSGISEVVVTGPGAPAIASLDDLSGQEVFVRPSSVYAESLERLNAELRSRGKAPAIIVPAPEVLEDDDLLEMVNAGLTHITIVDDYLADFWAKVMPDLTVHRDLAVRTDGTLAVAMRKGSPRLQEAVNAFLRRYAKGDATRNTLERRYLQNVKFAKNATSDAERQKLLHVKTLFEKYGKQYDLDYLLMAAQGYQESTLDQNAKSPVGAIGMMQVMPATGKDLNVGDITELDSNIHAGVKYMRFMMDQYFKDEPMDPLNKGLMTFASYNAGPGRVRQLRREAVQRNLDPNVWFGNVERVASERIGRETVTYVSNIYKYYVAYRLAVGQLEDRAAAKAQLKSR